MAKRTELDEDGQRDTPGSLGVRTAACASRLIPRRRLQRRSVRNGAIPDPSGAAHELSWKSDVEYAWRSSRLDENRKSISRPVRRRRYRPTASHRFGLSGSRFDLSDHMLGFERAGLSGFRLPSGSKVRAVRHEWSRA